MKLYIMYILILILTGILFMIVKDRLKALKITGIITTLSSIVLIVLTLITKIILTATIKSINISSIINYLINKLTYNSIILLIIGLVEILLSKYISTKKIIQ